MTLFVGRAFLGEKKNNIRATLFVRRSLFNRKDQIRAGQALDARRSRMMMLLVPKPQTDEALQSVFLDRNPKRDDPRHRPSAKLKPHR